MSQALGRRPLIAEEFVGPKIGTDPSRRPGKLRFATDGLGGVEKSLFVALQTEEICQVPGRIGSLRGSSLCDARRQSRKRCQRGIVDFLLAGRSRTSRMVV